MGQVTRLSQEMDKGRAAHVAAAVEGLRERTRRVIDAAAGRLGEMTIDEMSETVRALDER